MEKNEWTILVIGIILIIIHGLWTDFLIDGITITIYIIFTVPVLFKYLENLEIPGVTKLTFRKKLESLKDEYQKNKQKIKPDKQTEDIVNKAKKYYETFDFSLAEKNVKKYPNLALVSIRIEIENKLRTAYKIIFNKEEGISLIQLVELFTKANLFNKFQLSLLLKIITLCNSAVHGINITVSEAKEV